MIKYKIKFLIILLLGIVMLTSCSKQNDNLYKNEIIDETTLLQKNPILSIVNNEDKYTSLIKTIYSRKDLWEGKIYDCSIEEMNSKCKIECLRKIDTETYYSIFKTNENGILIILFKKNDDNELRAISFWEMEALLYKNSFKNLKKGKTLADVIAIDRRGERPINNAFMGLVNVPCISYHKTIDGYIVKITYERKYIMEESKIKKIEIKKVPSIHTAYIQTYYLWTLRP